MDPAPLERHDKINMMAAQHRDGPCRYRDGEGEWPVFTFIQGQTHWISNGHVSSHVYLSIRHPVRSYSPGPLSLSALICEASPSTVRPCPPVRLSASNPPIRSSARPLLPARLSRRSHSGIRVKKFPTLCGQSYVDPRENILCHDREVRHDLSCSDVVTPS